MKITWFKSYQLQKFAQFPVLFTASASASVPCGPGPLNLGKCLSLDHFGTRYEQFQ
jgi:hypothetical protein